MPIRDPAAEALARQLVLPRLTRMEHSEKIVKMVARLIQAAVLTDEQRAINEAFVQSDAAKESSK